MLIPRSIEEKYRSDRAYIEKQKELQDTIKERTRQEVIAFREDREQYMSETDKQIRILHLSDIHLGTSDQAKNYFTQLATDLTQNLKVKQLNYLVLSGDIANYSTVEEYDAAFELVDKLVNRYGLNPDRVITVPGNHDLNWDLSEEAYDFVPKRKLPNPLPEGQYIDAGGAGALIRDEERYQQRFKHFSDRLYKQVYSKPYPLEYDQQAILHPCPDDKILFLALNSCWELDHNYKDRASIKSGAIAHAIEQILDKYDDWLKIAVWHHPVTSAESIKNTAFLEQLATNGFQIAMHGHIHEAKNEYFKYDSDRGLNIIAAGTFGAPANQQLPGIPLQYNLLVLNPDNGELTVETRKKEKVDGAWSADARWGDKNNPVPRYVIPLRYGSAKKNLDNPVEESEANLTNEPEDSHSETPQFRQSAAENLTAGGSIYIGSITQIYGSDDLKKKEQLEPIIPVKSLVQQVQSHYSKKVQNLYSKIQLLNRERVDVDSLYVDVYFLKNLSSESYATIPKLLESSSDSKDNFDRLGLGKRQKRSPGLVAVEQSPRLVVLGKPGSGKSTFLRHLAVSCSKKELFADCIPILIELRAVGDTNRLNLLDLIHREFGLTKLEQTKQILDNGKALILLDGLDEVQMRLQKTIQDSLIDFSKQYYKNRFILTCRTQTTEYILPNFDYAEVADFNSEQVESFAQNWFQALAETPQEGEKLKEQFIAKLNQPENKQTIELAVTPVLLSLTCWVFTDLKDLPSKRSDLYTEGFNLLLSKWDKARGINRNSDSKIYQKLSTPEKIKLLSYLAAEKFKQKQSILFKQSELYQFIAEYLDITDEESEVVLKTIELQHGLLIERAQQIWSFSHLTFQEYLVARWFVDDMNWHSLLNNIAEEGWDNQWQQVFLLAVEMAKDAEQLLILMQSKINRFFLVDFTQDKDINKVINWAYKKSNKINLKYSDYSDEIKRFIAQNFIDHNNIQLFYFTCIYTELNTISFESNIVDFTKNKFDDDRLNQTVQEMEAELVTLAGRTDSLEGRLAIMYDDPFLSSFKKN